MANGYFERGEVYQIRSSDSFGSEQGMFRPGVIVSNDVGNRVCPTVLMAFMTTKDHNDHNNIETMATGRRSFVLCNQIATIDKRRLGNMMGVLNRAEMREVDDRLEEVFDLGYNDTAALNEKDREISNRDAVIAEKDAEIAELKAKLAEEADKLEQAELSFKVEAAMWQKLYEKALNQVVDMKYTNDLFLKNHLGREESKAAKIDPLPSKAPSEPPKTPEPPKPPVEPEVVVDERVDINNCTITALKKLGFSLALAKRIVDGRPYNAVSDLKNGLGMKATQYRIMEPKLRCTSIVEKKNAPSALVEPDLGYEEEPVLAGELPEAETEKIDINTIKATELHEKTGIGLSTCYSITGYRKKNGPYEKLEDLLNVANVSKGMVEKLRDKIAFEASPVRTGEKVNINTASAGDISVATGLSITVCYSITGTRKRNGPYKSVADLANVKKFTPAHMKKYGPMFEV